MPLSLSLWCDFADYDNDDEIKQVSTTSDSSSLCYVFFIHRNPQLFLCSCDIFNNIQSNAHEF